VNRIMAGYPALLAPIGGAARLPAGRANGALWVLAGWFDAPRDV